MGDMAHVRYVCGSTQCTNCYVVCRTSCDCGFVSSLCRVRRRRKGEESAHVTLGTRVQDVRTAAKDTTMSQTAV